MASPIPRTSARAPRNIQARLDPLVDLDRLGQAWRTLEPRSDPSFFQSWGWIGCWLRHLPPDRRALVASAWSGDMVVGLGVFVRGRDRRHGVLPARTLRLHESGEPSLDSLFVEHNGVLADRAYAPAVWAAILGLLIRRGAWDRVLLPGLAPPAVELCLEAACAHGRRAVVQQRRRSAELDLAALRASGRAFGDALSRNTRHQLARARRLYEAAGPLTLRSARSVDEALTILDLLKALHQTSWERRGQPGCFAAPAFESFHRDLIGARFASGEIQLLVAAAGDQPIGCLYNFVHGDRVYAYQSGFDYVADGRLKPGLVTHALAIEDATRTGFAVYDFMAGENRLKASLASHWTEMLWIKVQGLSAVAWLDRRLLDLNNRMRGSDPLRGCAESPAQLTPAATLRQIIGFRRSLGPRRA